MTDYKKEAKKRLLEIQELWSKAHPNRVKLMEMRALEAAKYLREGGLKNQADEATTIALMFTMESQVQQALRRNATLANNL
jgi:hypothetical protein